MEDSGMDLGRATVRAGRGAGVDLSLTVPEIHAYEVIEASDAFDEDAPTEETVVPPVVSASIAARLHASALVGAVRRSATRRVPVDPTIPNLLPPVHPDDLEGSAGEVELFEELPGERTRVESAPPRRSVPLEESSTVRVTRAAAPPPEPVEAVVRRVRDEEARRRRHDLDVALKAERARADLEREAIERRHRDQVARLESDLLSQIERLRGRITDGAPTAPRAGALPVAEPKSPPPFPAAARLVPARPLFHDDEDVATALTRESLEPPTGVMQLPPATPPLELLELEPLPWEMPVDPANGRRADALIARRTLADVARDAAASVQRGIRRPTGAVFATAMASGFLATLLGALVATGGGDLVERAAAEARLVAANDGAMVPVGEAELKATLAGVKVTLAAVSAANDEDEAGAVAPAGLAGSATTVFGLTPRSDTKVTAKPKARPRPKGVKKIARVSSKPAPGPSARVKRSPASDVVRGKLAAMDDAEKAEHDEVAAAVAEKRSRAKKARPGDPFPLDLVF